MSKNFVSVIIPIYNRCSIINICLKSVFKQTYRNYEVIVVDDGSTDNLKSTLSPLIKNGKITYLYQKNAGQGSARNLGAKHAKGDWLAFLDSDDTWYPDKLEKQLYRANINTGLLFSNAKFYKNGSYFGTFYKHISKKPMLIGDVYMNLLMGNFLINSTVLIRNKIFKQLGGFKSESVYRTVEDYELWLRASINTKFTYIHHPLISYAYPTIVTNKAKTKTFRGLVKIYKDNFKSCPIKYKLLTFKQYILYRIKLLQLRSK